MDAESHAAAPGVQRERDSRASLLWARFAQTRDLCDREELIESYMPLASATATRLFRTRIDDSTPYADYLQYARVGLIEAVDRYDPQREASFETFSSYRIRGAVLNGLGKESELAAQRTFWSTRTQERMESLKPAAHAGAASDLDELVQLTVGLALGLLLEDCPVDDSPRANPYAAAELSQMRSVIRRAVDQLPARERDIVVRHYFGHCEFQSIAHDLGITKGRVSQLHAQALARIRKLLGSSTSDVDFSL